MKSRQKIQNHLKVTGSIDAKQIAQDLALTPMGVRQHLYDMRDEGLVETTDTPAKRGRPIRKWALTPAADSFFPDGHQDLALDLILSIKTTLGDDAMETLLDARADKQENDYKERLAVKQEMRDRAQHLAKIRTDEGYMAHVEERDDGAIMFIENHCPICSAAKACSGICARELSVFKNLFGPNVQIDREEHILNGARRCAYKISETDV